MKFNELNLDPKVMEGIQDAGFVECTPVQEQTYFYGMQGKDVCVQSQTGTGKTAAFLITIFQNKCSGVRTGMALVVVPTRELAVQIEDEARLLGGPLGLNIACVYGGVGYNKQEEMLKGTPDLIIGTPGRLIDFGKTGKVPFGQVSTLVIDEADRLFDMGFMPDLRYMLKKMPPITERMTMLFSATLSSRVRQLAWEYMNNPEEVEISPENITVEQITQELYHVSKSEKLPLLLGLLKKENPENALVFTNTKHMAVELAWRLSENGYKAQYIMGDLPQKKRLQVIQKLKSGELEFLVATDVAARGLHINDLAMVVNYDIPEDFENYVHRIGRTARAGKSGKAVTLACEKYVYGLEAIEEYINMKIPVLPVTEELLGQDLTAGKVFHDPDRYGQEKGRGRDRDRSRSGERPRSGDRSRPDRSRSDRPRPESRVGSGDRPRTGDRSRAGDRPRTGDRSQPGGHSRQESYSRPSGRDQDRDGRRVKTGAAGAGPDVRSGEKRGRSAAPEARRGEKDGSLPGGKPRDPAVREKAPAAGTLDDRLAYYRKKYGEDFQPPQDGVKEAPGGKEGFFKRLFKGFGKKDG